MKRLNAVITVTLAILAASAWFATLRSSLFPSLDYDRTHSLALAATALACVGWLLVFWSERRGDRETRCRKCQHILRGLSEARCPECGERI